MAQQKKGGVVMKTIRNVMSAVCALGILLASSREAEAQAGNSNSGSTFAFPAIGTVPLVENYAARATAYVSIFAWAYKTNGQEAVYGSTGWAKGTNAVISKTQLDQQIIVPGLSIMLHNFCTNTDQTWDKSRGIIISISCIISDPNFDLSQSVLWYYNTIQLVKNSDGSWSVPDLSGFSTQLGDPMPFYVPNAQWARAEIGYKGDTDPFEVDDDLYDPGSSPLSSDGFVYLDTSYITDSSSTNGDFWMKITLFDGTNFQIFDGDGNPVPETPMVPALNQSGTNATVTVNGGDSGRGFVLQSSADLSAWTNCSPVTFISPTNDLPGALPSRFVYPVTNRALFFRTATTNLPPM
jgi:hypothetical protein